MVDSVTLNGNTYNDGSTPPNNMANGGHRTYLFPLLQDFLVEAATLIAATGLSLTATSATSLTIASSGSVSATVSTGKGFSVGSRLRFARTSAPTTTYMEGVVTAYNADTGAMTFTRDNSLGSGTHTDWTITVVGDRGPTGSVEVSTDTSPQLGGHLDVNGFNITSATNGDINIAPHGTGEVKLSGDEIMKKMILTNRVFRNLFI